MKILHIPTGGLFADGIFSCISAYITEMNRDRVEIDILATNQPKQEIVRQVQEMNCNLIVVPYRKQSLLKYFIELCKVLKKNKYDVVHVHGSSAIMCIELFAAKLVACKVRVAHSHNTTCEHQRVDRILRPIFYQLYTHAFACGQDAGKWLFRDKKFIVIPNARNLEKYKYNSNKRKQWRKRLNIDETTLIIGHVGRINKQKNHKYLIEIFKEVKELREDSKLLLVGNGELMNEIKDKVRLLGLEKDILFLGVLENVNDLLSAMDIMVFPSLYEGLPLVVIEWQAAGLPCFIADTITDECVIESNVKKISINELPKTWAELIVNTELKERFENNKKIEADLQKAGYDITIASQMLKELYQKFIDEEIK